MENDKVFFDNPIIAEQAKIEEACFIPDPVLGHKLPEGRDFIGQNDYISFKETVEKIKSSKKKVLLNLGDSSTSGWNSDIVTENRERMKNGLKTKPAFFTYKTYSDFLEDTLKDEFVVINAGIPAYTSLQGLKRIELLMDDFRKEGIAIDYMTIYYGNNDSVWNANKEEKDWLKISASKNLKEVPAKESDHVVVRVSPADYKDNIGQIISRCRKNGSIPIVIKPLTPLYWKPGTRVKNEEPPRSIGNGSVLVYSLLEESRQTWAQALADIDYSPEKMALLELVREKDYIVPRIKKDHLNALREIIGELQTAFVDVELDRTEDDIRYFIDYCHPINEANEYIAHEVIKIIGQFEKGERVDKKISLEIKETDKKRGVAENMDELPTEHYTLY